MKYGKLILFIYGLTVYILLFLCKHKLVCVCVERHNQISDKKKIKLIDASFMKYPHISSKQLKYQVRGLKKCLLPSSFFLLFKKNNALSC